MDQNIYNEDYFARFSEGSLRSAGIVLPEVLRLIPASAIVDVGCGIGTWASTAKLLGVDRVLGIDGAKSGELVLGQDEFLQCPLEDDFASRALERLGRRCDLAMCLEVAEHLPKSAAMGLVEGLTNLSDAILFSAAIPFQGGVHHVNEQWPEWWALRFLDRNYVCIDYLRDVLWQDADVEWWYAQNTLLFVKAPVTAMRRRHGTAPLARVHPINYLARAGATVEEMMAVAELMRLWCERPEESILSVGTEMLKSAGRERLTESAMPAADRPGADRLMIEALALAAATADLAGDFVGCGNIDVRVIAAMAAVPCKARSFYVLQVEQALERGYDRAKTAIAQEMTRGASGAVDRGAVNVASPTRITQTAIIEKQHAVEGPIVPHAPERQGKPSIAIVWLGTDSYNTTLGALQVLVGHVVSGGLVVLEKYAVEDEYARAVHEYLVAAKRPLRIECHGNGLYYLRL